MQPSASQAAIGPYRLQGELARGATSVVYRALTPVGDPVALKLFQASDERARARFAEEVAACLVLEHPYLLKVRDSGEFQQRPYLVTDLVEGDSLAARLARGPLAPSVAAELVRKLAEGIERVHQSGLLHRDLTPANVILRANGDPVLIDFGLTRPSEGPRASLTATGGTVGTPGYLPPEQAANEKALVGPRSDVYGLGAVLYASLTGRPPIEGQSWVEVLAATCQRAPVAPSLLTPGLDPELEELCLRCLRKDPQDRPGSAAEVAQGLASYLDFSRPTSPASRGPTRGLLLAAGLAALVALTAAWWPRSRAATEPGVEPGPQPTPSPARSAPSSDDVQALIARGDLSGAEEAIAALISADPAALEPWITRARVARQRGSSSDAARWLERALELDPEHAEARLLRAELAWTRGEPEAACDDLRRALRAEPDLGAAWELLARAELALGRRAQALVAADGALGRRPASVSAHEVRLEVFRWLGRHDLAQLEAEALLQRGETRQRRWERLRAAALSQRLELARADLALLRPLSAEEGARLRELVQALSDQFHLPGPQEPKWLAELEEFVAAAALDLDAARRPGAIVLQATIAIARDDGARAEELFFKAAEGAPIYLNAAGVQALSMGHLQRAEAAFALAPDRRRFAPLSRVGRALVAALRGDAPAALRSAREPWQELVREDPYLADVFRLQLGEPALSPAERSPMMADALATRALVPGQAMPPAEAEIWVRLLQVMAGVPVSQRDCLAAAHSGDARRFTQVIPWLLRLRQPARTIEALEAMDRHAPGVALLRTRRLQALSAHDPQQALKFARSLPGDMDYALGVQLALLESRYGEVERAVHAYRRALRLRPDDVAVINALAALLTETGAPEALKLARVAHLRGPSAATLETLGWARYGAGELAEAEEALRAAVTEEGRSWTSRLRLAAALAARGRAREASAQLRCAQLLRPLDRSQKGRQEERCLELTRSLVAKLKSTSSR